MDMPSLYPYPHEASSVSEFFRRGRSGASGVVGIWPGLGGKTEEEHASGAPAAGHVDPAAVTLHDGFAERETEAEEAFPSGASESEDQTE